VSRFVITSGGSRVNVDRLLEIRFEKVPRPAPRVVDRVRIPEPARARIYGIVSAEDRALDVELLQGSAEAVSRLWARWEGLARDGMNLARVLELEELTIAGRDPGAIAAGLEEHLELEAPVAPEPELELDDYPRPPFTDGRFTGHDHVSFRRSDQVATPEPEHEENR